MQCTPRIKPIHSHSVPQPTAFLYTCCTFQPHVIIYYIVFQKKTKWMSDAELTWESLKGSWLICSIGGVRESMPRSDWEAQRSEPRGESHCVLVQLVWHAGQGVQGSSSPCSHDEQSERAPCLRLRNQAAFTCKYVCTAMGQWNLQLWKSRGEKVQIQNLIYRFLTWNCISWYFTEENTDSQRHLGLAFLNLVHRFTEE